MRAMVSCLFLLTCAANACAADCQGPFPVGFRNLSLADGRAISVWYPKASNSSPACGSRWPLVLFSHGFAGCSTQAVFITEEIARHGYVVAAPDHRDALCLRTDRAAHPPGNSTRPSFLDPQAWNDNAWRERMLDMRDTLQLVLHDDALGRMIDPSRIGLVGHSLGGYTVLGMAGGWPGWDMPGVRAALAFSPFVEPFLTHHRLADLKVPVMYEGGTLDFGITPSVVRAGGAYDESRAPKFLVELAGASHLAWTDWPCGDHDAVADCLATVPNARLIDAYAIAFLDRYLKDQPAPLLDEPGKDLAAYRSQH